ncbi:MAG: hypothetical protein R3B82_20665 [Sandaracinaceae bacterium]
MALLTGCGSSFTPTDGGGVDAGSMDGGATGTDASTDASTGDAGFACVPVTCDLACMHGFRRGADGCEICVCNPPPVDTCAVDADCVIARVATGCCSCEFGYPVAQVEADPCLVTRYETPPPGCLPDPDFCAMVDCAACEAAVRAYCDAGTCRSSGECALGEVQIGLECVPACTSHADCTLAADYGQCCGTCQAVPRGYLDLNECFAERQSDSACAPPAGACDDLGCPSPPSDCTAFSGSALCMDDGTCREGGSDAACPPGYHDESSVCVAD